MFVSKNKKRVCLQWLAILAHASLLFARKPPWSSLNRPLHYGVWALPRGHFLIFLLQNVAGNVVLYFVRLKHFELFL